MKQTYLFLTAAFCLLCTSPALADDTKTLDVNGLLATSESYFLSDNESDFDGTYYNTTFTNDIFVLSHSWASWGFGGGFTYSNCTDVTTPGYSNMSAYAGTGANGESYLFSNSSSFTPAVIEAAPLFIFNPQGVYITNSTYAALSMLQGDGMAKQFGGANGTDPDWFLLTITGYDTHDNPTGSVEFYLADYRSEDNSQDYIVKDWTWVDLTPLGRDLYKIDFSLTSSDNGMWGMNTPSYFCLDGLEVQYDRVIGVESVFSENANVYFANGILYTEGLQNTDALLYNSQGELLRTFHIDNDAFSTPLPVSAGVFILKATSGNANQTFKFVVN